ncbi:WhiB family transcriptional regulator [Pengzhenrongella frigida]|uniref:4Fe-4S Wbl-type domain-containing protein n=1 Tax=Pengzhenrongella frigida TaxID=1259133 RepID=A0A4Q5N1U5_9MICO|nr:WhiB family transcriptional regulator [Cellulomonas sp. HLT2-17]RYV52055.1 hypothetical protein EUA98_05680 [Cellulomonas sp. HLT2-17]
MTTRADLLEALGNLSEVGRVAPCWADPLAGWVSEIPREVRAAKRLCAPCPAFTGCREYGTGEGKRELGVYAGQSMTERLNRTTNPTKAA